VWSVNIGLAKIYKKVKPAVVAIASVEEVGSRVTILPFGSGFCVDPNGIIVTARHVVTEYYEKVLEAPLPHSHTEAIVPLPKPDFYVVFFRKSSDKYETIYPLVISYMFPFPGDHPEDDVAVLGIPKCPDYWGAGYPCLELGDLSTVREGGEIAISGYPLRRGALPDLSKGIVSRIEEKLGANNKWEITKLVLDIRINPGNSGSPVFETHSGSVLGLVSEEVVRDPDDMPSELRGLFKIPTGIVYCIPSALISKAISAFKSHIHSRNAP